MSIRITEQSRLTDQVNFLQTAAERMSRVQEELATNRRIQQASDDPEGTSISMGYRQDIVFETQMRRNVEGGVAFMNATESALSSATDVIQRARELAVQGASSTNSQEGRDAMAIEVDQLLQQMVQIGNSNFGGAYIFAGHKTDQPAFTTAGAPTITSVAYAGDLGLRLRRISPQTTEAVNVPGSSAFGTVFSNLIALRDNFRSGVANVNLSIAALDHDLDLLMSTRADVGARINVLDDVSLRSSRKDVDLQALRANIEDVDVPDAIVRLTAQQNQLQATLGAIGKTLNMTLLDYIR